VGVLLRPENQVVLDGVAKYLRSVKNMRTVMTDLQKGAGSMTNIGGGIRRSVWRNLSQVRDGISRALLQLPPK
jgi:hypothetical protein